MRKLVKCRSRILLRLVFILMCLAISEYEGRKIEPEKDLQHKRKNVSPNTETRGVDGRYETETGVRRCLGKACENVDTTTTSRHHKTTGSSRRRTNRNRRIRHGHRHDDRHRPPAIHAGHHDEVDTKSRSKQIPRIEGTNRRQRQMKAGRKHSSHHKVSSSQQSSRRTSRDDDVRQSRKLPKTGRGLVVDEKALQREGEMQRKHVDMDLQISPAAVGNVKTSSSMQSHSPYSHSRRRQGYRRRYGYGQRAPASVSRLEQRMRPKLSVAVHKLKHTMSNMLEILQKKVRKISESFSSINSDARHDIAEVKEQLKFIHDENNRAYGYIHIGQEWRMVYYFETDQIEDDRQKVILDLSSSRLLLSQEIFDLSLDRVPSGPDTTLRYFDRRRVWE